MKGATMAAGQSREGLVVSEVLGTKVSKKVLKNLGLGVMTDPGTLRGGDYTMWYNGVVAELDRIVGDNK
jgi:hypothetical protein